MELSSGSSLPVLDTNPQASCMLHVSLGPASSLDCVLKETEAKQPPAAHCLQTSAWRRNITVNLGECSCIVPESVSMEIFWPSQLSKACSTSLTGSSVSHFASRKRGKVQEWERFYKMCVLEEEKQGYLRNSWMTEGMSLKVFLVVTFS